MHAATAVCIFMSAALVRQPFEQEFEERGEWHQKTNSGNP